MDLGAALPAAGRALVRARLSGRYRAAIILDERRSPDLAALNEFYDSVGFGRLLRNQAERILERWG